tara:strand:- start:4112 stop:4732 length:621 start_codon:yes stop_codon:yes gene_type:complete
MSSDSQNSTELLIKKFIILGVIVSIIVIGWGFVQKDNQGKKIALSNKLHSLDVDKLSKLSDGKITGREILDDFKSLVNDSKTPEVALAFALKFNDQLVKKKNYELSAELLSSLEGSVQDVIARQVLLSRLAYSHEETGNFQKATETLNTVLSLKHLVLEDKTYFDLGRLYIRLGNNEKAKSSLNYVIDKSKDTELVKLAKYFLAKI